MSPAMMKRPAYRYSICGFSMIGAAIRYAEIVNTTIGMMIGTCNKYETGVLYMAEVKLGYVIILRMISSQRNFPTHVRYSANKGSNK
jgi:hypothetical protein